MVMAMFTQLVFQILFNLFILYSDCIIEWCVAPSIFVKNIFEEAVVNQILNDMEVALAASEMQSSPIIIVSLANIF